MGLSNNIIALLNFFAFLASLPVTGAGIWLASNHDTACLHPFRWPLLLLGLFLLLVSLSGFVGAYWNRQGLLALYLFAMALLILLLLALLIFAFVISRPDGSYAPDPARPSFTDYRLAGYHPWLRRYVSSSAHWSQIRRCLAQSSDVCPKLANQLLSPDQFFLTTHLSPLQSGCCKPPLVCGYGYVGATVWTNPANPGADADCWAWSNDPAQLCYGCESCKAGLLGGVRKEWRRANVILIVALVVLIWVYLIACSAFKNAQTEDLFRRYKYGFA